MVQPLQRRVLQQMSATEESRLAKPVVWLGWKGHKPTNVNNHQVCFSLDDVTAGSYVCLQPHEDSEYFKVPKFEVAKVLSIPEDLSSEEAEMQVEYQQFDP